MSREGSEDRRGLVFKAGRLTRTRRRRRIGARMCTFPSTPGAMVALQERIARLSPGMWHPPSGPMETAGCFVCFPRGGGGAGEAGTAGWAGAALVREGEIVATALVRGATGAPYLPGLLGLREGPLLEAAVRALPRRPELLLVNATGRDHPRRAGLALHLGALLDLPSVGVTDRLLLATGDWPGEAPGESAPFRLAPLDELGEDWAAPSGGGPTGETVGLWLRCHRGVKPIAVHAAWRTSPETAGTVVLRSLSGRSRTPTPLREARRLARQARANG